VTGANLVLGGYFMQALVRNPLADPYIMGVTAGAGLGVNVLALGLVPLAALTVLSYPAFAGLGALLSLLLVLGLGFRSLMEDSARLLIAGVAVSALLSALTGVLIYLLADDDQLRQVVFWAFGSFARATQESVWVSGALLVTGLAFAWVYAPRLDVLQLGDMQALALGLDTTRARLLVLAATSIVVGGNIAFTGPVGFVGIIIPHVCRNLYGGLHRPNLIPAALMGGGYLALCDSLSRLLLPPAGLPVGIVTSLFGVPFFLYLLFSRDTYL
jgi:iron complex transport system permease protein